MVKPPAEHDLTAQPLTAQECEQAFEEIELVGDALNWGVTQLQQADVFLGHGTDSYHDESVGLLLYVLNKPWDVDPAIVNEPISDEHKDAFIALIKRRIHERVPAPYLTGTAWFCGLQFSVDERVLIPRSPIAELIETGFAPWIDPDSVHRVLDLCTGGGCIAIACAHALPNALVDASDIDEAALQVCQQNIDAYDLNDRVTAIQSDGLDAVHGGSGAGYDVIVSNPPYVDAEDMASLPQEYRHEPELALASGSDGLDFTRTLLAKASDHLNDGGILIVEVGNSMEALQQQYPSVPFVWLEFERGGHGVFLLTKAQLIEFQSLFGA